MTAEPYAIAWTPAAQRTLRHLPEKVGVAAVELCYGSLAANPRRAGHELALDLAGLYSARRGDYRVIYSIDDATRTVTVHDLPHRSDAYRPRG